VLHSALLMASNRAYADQWRCIDEKESMDGEMDVVRRGTQKECGRRSEGQSACQECCRSQTWERESVKQEQRKSQPRRSWLARRTNPKRRCGRP
jgi:hypothetical protein